MRQLKRIQPIATPSINYSTNKRAAAARFKQASSPSPNNRAFRGSHGDLMAKYATKLINSSGVIRGKPGERVTAWAEFINTGTEVWTPSVRLGAEQPLDRYSIFAADN